ncbi:glycosyltransferase family 39 protein [Piscinibacter gummiphilus]|uniref:Glycosyltransferase family 39 protein n=1 Tax=Piscinibacter gummiphilus TaxID=946333 RepID=A0ABZ0D0H1_9BURK|nr:glycosyltransferase family 39 protein [Piscinibacter gummiphilus]WOB10236.1 glycosyltransferase family 39 protein [Piscinibacter gummiphilus]
MRQMMGLGVATEPAWRGMASQRWRHVKAWGHEWGWLAATLAWLVVTAWARPLALPDEGRYVGVAWAMLTSGDWVVPQLDGLPYFHKPPLFYWITAGSLSLFGPSEWAARAGPLLGAAAGTVAAFLFVRRWWSASVARAMLLAFATQPLAFVGAQFANLDMLVAGCIAVTIFSFAHAALEAGLGQRPSRRVLVAGYAFAALGVLAKGLIGLVLPGVVLLAWCVASRRLRVVPWLLWPPGLALFAAIVVPWFAAMQWRFPAFAHYFFVVQHFSRYAQGGFNNVQPWWFCAVAIAVLCLPWSAWLVLPRRGGLGGAEVPALRSLMWSGLLVITVFFSIPQSKLVGYLLPVTWPLALLVADKVTPLTGEGHRRRLWAGSLVLAVAACLAAVTAFALRGDHSTRDLSRPLATQLQPGDQIFFLHDAYFDLPFYARLRQPVRIVEDWGEPDIAARDNWRKELADAARFAPDRAATSLVTPAQFGALLCSGSNSWVVGHPANRARYAALASAEQVATAHETVLWRVAAGVSREACPETPSPSSAGR